MLSRRFQIDLVWWTEKQVKLAFETVLFERRRSEFGRFQPTERKFFEWGRRSQTLSTFFPLPLERVSANWRTGEVFFCLLFVLRQKVSQGLGRKPRQNCHFVARIPFPFPSPQLPPSPITLLSSHYSNNFQTHPIHFLYCNESEPARRIHCPRWPLPGCAGRDNSLCWFAGLQ